MSNRQQIVHACGQAMIDAETKTDEALAATAEAMAAFVRGRIAASISATSGHSILERMRNGIDRAVEMRGFLVESHNGLEAFRRLHGLEAPTLIGPVDKPPTDMQPLAGLPDGLRVVAARKVA